MVAVFLWTLMSLDRGESTRRTSLLAFVGVFLVGGALRVAWAIVVPTLPVSDFLDFHKKALELAQGTPVRTKTLGYVMLLSLGYRISATLLAGKLINAIASTFSLVFIYIIGYKLAGPKTAWIAALFYALYPSEINMVSVLGTEVLATASALGIAAFFIAGVSGEWNRKHGLAIVCAGLLYGVGLVTRMSLLFYLPIVLLGIALLAPFAFRQKAKIAGLFFTGLVAGLGTMVAGYSIMVGQFSTAPLKMRDSVPFLTGTNILSGGQYNLDDDVLYRSWPLEKRDARARQEALQRLVSDPAGFLKIAPVKMETLFALNEYSTTWSMEALDWGTGNMWGADSNGGENWIKYRDQKYNWMKASNYLSQVFYSTIWLFAFCALLKKRMSALALLALAVLFLTLLPHMILEVQGRYHHIVMPFITLLAASGLSNQPERESQSG